MSLTSEQQTEIKLHNHTIVKLIDYMGSDDRIEQCARVSYGECTRKTSETRGLIRYLMNHRHTTPFESCVVSFYLKMPIFCMRQFVRHRTASINEYSARYSVMKDEFYLPSFDYMKPQSKTNKQGREGDLEQDVKDEIETNMASFFEDSSTLYHWLLNIPGSEDSLSRELARIVMPVSNYTELYWTCNLHNVMHMLKLRMDPHAQQEIRDIAQAMYDILKPLFPLSFEAFEDYVLNAKTFSAMEMNWLQDIIGMWKDIIENHVDSKKFEPGTELFQKYFMSDNGLMEKYNMTAREVTEFRNKINL